MFDYYIYQFARILGYLIVLVPLGLIGGVITYFVTSRNKQKALFGFGLTMLILVLLIAVMKPAQSQQLSASFLQQMRNQVNVACFDHQRSDKVNRAVNNRELRDYCACWSNELIKNTTSQKDLDELVKLQRKGATPEEVLPVFLKGRDANKLAGDCAEQMFNKGK